MLIIWLSIVQNAMFSQQTGWLVIDGWANNNKTVDKVRYRVDQLSLRPAGAGLVMVEDLSFATAYLGDIFDLAQTIQPEDMDFSLQQQMCLSTWVYMYVTQKEKRQIQPLTYKMHTQALPPDSHRWNEMKMTRCQCDSVIPSEQLKAQALVYRYTTSCYAAQKNININSIKHTYKHIDA